MKKLVDRSTKLKSNKLLTINIFFMLVIALIMLIPFVWMILSSFKTDSEILAATPTLFPQNFTLDSYETLFNEMPMGRIYINTLFIAISKTVFAVFTSALMGYVFAKFVFKGKNILFSLTLSTMMIPFPLIIIPLYLEIAKFHWIDNYLAIIVPGVYSAFGIFLMRQAMQNFPDELRESARIDGCIEVGIFFRIVLPLQKAALASLTIFTFMGNWDDFLWPLVVLQTRAKYTLPLELSLLTKDMYSTKYALAMAGAVVGVVPIMLVFILMQRNFIESIAMTGIKS